MSAWITDRVPTHSDTTYYVKGKVWIQNEKGERRLDDYDYVELGTPWQPITYPEPYVKEPVWKWEYSDMNGYVDISQNGNFRWSIRLGNGVTEAHIDAMTDALNKLEETP